MCQSCNRVTDPKEYRHRWEMPLVIVAAVLSVLAILFSLTVADSLGENAAEGLGEWRHLGFLVLGAPVLIFVARLYMGARERGNGARVGPRQFPEIWEIYENLLLAFDLPHPPALYVVNCNGAVNAFALSCTVRRKYVMLNAEIAALVQVDPRIVRFVLAHELAHHKLGHVSLIRQVIGVVMNAMYLPGKAYIRAQEYSADRLAMAVCPDAADSLVFLTVGPWMAERISADAFADQIEEDNRGPMMRLVNIASDHAVMVKRFKALRDIQRHGFSSHGEMF